MGLPEKPRYASPCNHCGKCCAEQLCPAGVIAFPKSKAPCPALVIADNKALCGLVIAEEKAALEPFLKLTLGIGFGCSMPDGDTTDNEILEFNAASQSFADLEWTEMRKTRIARLIT